MVPGGIVRKIYTAAIVVSSVAVLATGCSMNKMVAGMSASVFRQGVPALEREPDPQIAEQTAPVMIKMTEALLESAPNNEDLLTLLAQSYGNYAFAFIDDDVIAATGNETEQKIATDRAKYYYALGRDAGLKVLKKNGTIRKGLAENYQLFEKGVQGLGKSDVPVLFWTAFNWGNWINYTRDNPFAVADLAKVQAMMTQVLKLDEKYYYGSPHAFFGVYYGSRPTILGGNPEKSREHFDKASAVSGGKYLMPKVMYAQFYAVQAQDKELYRKLLNEVIAADPNALPDQILANKLAIGRAKILLAKEKNFF